jgi:hypothetical protein
LGAGSVKINDLGEEEQDFQNFLLKTLGDIVVFSLSLQLVVQLFNS